jgi:hypothetical protein
MAYTCVTTEQKETRQLTNSLFCTAAEFYITHYEGYSKSYLRLFWAINVGVWENSRMRGSVTRLIALQTIT